MNTTARADKSEKFRRRRSTASLSARLRQEPRQAPADGYEPVLIKHECKERIQKAYSDYREDRNYFFRVRTKKDAQGNIISVLYGKIYGDFNHAAAGGKLTFTYYLNPEPNSLDMEFDPSRNLFKKLPPLERVSAP
ncbi:MAG: hypothetical protein ABSG80_02905 [Verrucomicrobiota bacterium]